MSKTDEMATRLRDTFDAIADHTVVTNAPVPPPERALRHRRRAALIAVAATVVVTAGVGAWIASRPTTSNVATVHSKPLPTPRDGGTKISLTKVPTPPRVRAALVADGWKFRSRSSLVTLRPGAGPLLTITRETTDNRMRYCTLVLNPSNPSGWNSRACSGGLPRKDPLVGYGPLGRDSFTYYTWVNVPHGTAYTTLVTDRGRAWQRPLAGISVMPIDGQPTRATLRAFARDDRVLATARIARFGVG